MAKIRLNEEEIMALTGEEPILWVIYILAIRWHMDFKTGIAGRITKFNHSHFLQCTDISKTFGRKAKRITRTTLRNSFKRLENIGLIRPLGQYVFECPVAERDEQDQKRSVASQYKNNTEVSAEVSTKNACKKRKEKTGKSMDCMRTTQDRSVHRSAPMSEEGQSEVGAISGVSGNTANNNSSDTYNKKPLEALSNSPKPRIATLALEILNYLRKKTGRSFGEDGNHLKEITARLKDKPAPTIEDCKLVIDFMYDRWIDSDEMRKNLNPTTLFRKKNFYRYLDAVREGSDAGNEAAWEARMKRMAEEKAAYEESFRLAQEEYNARLREQRNSGVS